MIVSARINVLVRGLFWVLCVVVVAGALVPQDALTTTFALSDKIVHTGAFLVLSALGLCGYPSRMTVILSLIALGGAIEIAQSFTTTRSHEWLDFLANGLGVLLGCTTVFAIKGREQ
jgi:VanZ family protein